MIWLLCLLPMDDVARECCDLVELNHFYSETGQPVFDQVIWSDWSFADGRYQVVGWRLIKCQGIIPIKDHQTGCYVSRWYDDETYREVFGRARLETWTQYDPEMAEREILPKEKRRGLKRFPVRRL